MAIKKNQHYVPQFYLRNFSKNGKSLNLFNISNKRIICGDSIKNQCSDDYFYGKDGVIENTFQNIETSASELIIKIISEKYIPRKSSQDYEMLLLFIITLHSRTKYKHAELNEIINKVGDAPSSESPNASKRPYINTDKNRFSIPLPIITAFASYHLAKDLNIHLILNETDIGFVTSDHPVVYYNKWNEHVKDYGTIGLATKGLLIILPLSPKLLLVLYDQSIYKIGNKRDIINSINKSEDVVNFNLLQWLSSDDNIYFYENSDSAQILDDSKKFVPLRNVNKVEAHKLGRSLRGEVISFHSQKLRMKLNVSFIKIKAHAKRIEWKKGMEEIRNPKLLELIRGFRKEIKSGKYKITEWDKYLNDARV